MRRILIASTSTVHSSGYLTYLQPALSTFFEGIQQLLFIPYARPSGITYDAYTARVSEAFKPLNITVKGIHEFKNPIEAVQKAEAIFTGGGNTFELVNQLYKNNMMQVLKSAVNAGTPYLGTSAGSNICGLTMMNTNDMPIVYPPSFETMGLIPFNINAHYLDPIEGSTHMGETRETRIQEYHTLNQTPVLGLREGSWLEVQGSLIVLRGPYTARVFKAGATPFELESGSEVLL
ncbi:dipeptidase PepE [Bizionia sp.]|uniref:dipeptidase PepE n=1 Tax=Bizionia sp. TaxID=1954480 RepID=UPI003A91D524